MTTASRHPFLSGWCGTRSHGACAGRYGQGDLWATCTCPCHTPEPEPQPAPDPVRLTLVPAVPLTAVEEQTEDLGAALTVLTGALTVLAQALTDFDGNGEELCDLLGRLRANRQALAELESIIENRAAKAMTDDHLEWPGGSAERRWGKDRKEWDHPALTRAVTAAIIPPLAVNPTTGEVDTDLAALLHQAVEAYSATNRPSWRVTAVKPLGIDPDEFCSAVPGRASVSVNLARTP